MRGFFIFYSVFILLMLTCGIATDAFYALRHKKQRSIPLAVTNGGYGAARSLLNANKLFDINAVRVRSGKKDYYDSNNKILFLSEESYSCSTVYAVSRALLAASIAIQQKTKTSFHRVYPLIPAVEYLLKFVMPFSILGLIFGFSKILVSFAAVMIIFSLIIIFVSFLLSVFCIVKVRSAKTIILNYLELKKKEQADSNKQYIKSNTLIDNNDSALFSELKAAVQSPPPSLLILTLLSPVFFLRRH